MLHCDEPESGWKHYIRPFWMESLSITLFVGTWVRILLEHQGTRDVRLGLYETIALLVVLGSGWSGAALPQSTPNERYQRLLKAVKVMGLLAMIGVTAALLHR